MQVLLRIFDSHRCFLTYDVLPIEAPLSHCYNRCMFTFALSLISVFFIAIILVVGKAILVPLIIAVFIWYLINALSKAYGKILPNHTLSSLLSVATLVCFLWLPVQLISSTIPQVVQAAPAYQKNVEQLVHNAAELLGMKELPAISELLDQLNIGQSIAMLAKGVADVTGYTVMVLIYLVFLLMEQGRFTGKLAAIFDGDKKGEEQVKRILKNTYTRIQTYILIKTISSLITGVLGYLVMVAVGLDFAPFWAVLMFFLNFIPNVGSIIATIFPSLLALIQFDTLYPFLTVAGGITLFQVLIGSVIEPKLLGDSLNLSPLVIILSLVTWGSIWGIPGMFLCVPLMVIITIILSEFKTTRPLAILLSANGKVKNL